MKKPTPKSYARQAVPHGRAILWAMGVTVGLVLIWPGCLRHAPNLESI